MNRNFLFFILLFCLSCGRETEQVIAPKFACEQRMELIRATGGFPVSFGFDLSVEEEFDYFEKQTGLNNCNQPKTFSVDMALNDSTSINIQLLTDRYCAEDSTDYMLACFRPSTLMVLMNSQSNLLVEDEFCELDSLRSAISRGITQDMLDWNNRRVLISVLWDSVTPVPFRKKVFNEVIQGYLDYADQRAMESYGKDVCSLDSVELHTLKDECKLIFMLEDHFYRIPPPPPPREG